MFKFRNFEVKADSINQAIVKLGNASGYLYSQIESELFALDHGEWLAVYFNVL